MPTDLEIIAELEREIGRELPRRKLHAGLPERKETADGKVSFTGGRPFDGFWWGPCFGYFVNENRDVVGLAVCGATLTSVPKSLLKLSHLQRLNLGQNEIEALPVNLTHLRSLEILQLFGNRLRSLPATLPHSLQELYAISNQIEDLPPFTSRLKYLKLVDASDNKIKSIPPWIFQMGLDIHVGASSGSGIILNDNPIESPPVEIIQRGKDAVREYFASLEGERLRLNEVKVLLVGDGGAGKTCLVKQLLGEGFDPHEGQTDGINIDPWMIDTDGEEVKVHLWDFGGQEIMHATHQFFLSERSVYVLVLDGRKEEDAEYWLKHIESFGGDSPVLVVLNKMDENPGFDVNRRFLGAKYQGLVDFYGVSCKTGKGIKAFRKGLKEAIGRVEMIRTTWPSSWFKIKTQLEEMTDHYIGAEAYRDMCQQAGIEQESGQDTLVEFLHDLGVIVHFADFHLQHMHVLEPRWLTGAVYRIINSQELAENKGVLKLKALREILKPRDDDDFNYPIRHHPYIVEMMKKFELCYSIDDQTVLIPDLLEVQEPAIDFDYDGSLRFRIDYDFLPKSVIPRFIVRKSASIVGNLRWRTGVVLQEPAFDARAVVKADVAARRIYIYVGGPQRQDYLTVIRSAFLDINRRFEKLDYLEMVPLFDDPGVVISYNHLVHLAKEGVEQHYPDQAKHAYDVKELLRRLQIERKLSKKEFVEILRSVASELDDEKSLLRKINDVIMLQPNFMGLGIDLNALIEEFLNSRNM